MPSISTSSYSSGSLTSYVSQLMSLEREPIYELEDRKDRVNAKTAYYDKLATYLEDLQDLAEDFTDTEDNTIFNAVSVSSSDSDTVSVKANDDAAVGTFNIRVKQLATSTSMISTSQLNSSIAAASAFQVVAGSDELDIYESFADAGFETEATGTITINGKEFNLADYETVNDMLTDIRNDSTANVNIYYNETLDKIFIENDDPSATKLSISETAGASGVGFFTAINMETGEYGNLPSQNSPVSTGLQTDVLLHKVNFDTELDESDTGSFKINGISIDWNAGEDTLNEIISRINSSEAGVTAFYDDSLDKVMITSNTQGSGEIQFEDVEGTFLSESLKFNGVVQNLGQDAIFTINSTDSANEITKSSNTFELNGLEINLNDVTVANGDYTDSDTTSVQISSTKNTSQVKKNIENFISKFNGILEFVKTNSEIDMDTYTRGALTGETVFRDVRFSLLNIATSTITDITEGDPSTLIGIGIEFDEDMNLTIADSDLLEDFLVNDSQAVQNLFNSTDGIATRVAELIDPYLETDGIIDVSKEGIESQIESIDNNIERQEERLERLQEYYIEKYAALQNTYNAVIQQQSLMDSILASVASYTS